MRRFYKKLMAVRVDKRTADNLELLMSLWQVSKSEAVRRCIRGQAGRHRGCLATGVQRYAGVSERSTTAN